MRTWWPKLRRGGMLAGDDFADLHDTFSQMSQHRAAGWGVKSAVVAFAKQVGSPFFLTFADHDHQSTEYTPGGSREFTTEQHSPSDVPVPPDAKRPAPKVDELPPADQRVRAQRFYPAWYMFK